MSLISLNFDDKFDHFFPNFGQGPVPKFAEKTIGHSISTLDFSLYLKASLIT